MNEHKGLGFRPGPEDPRDYSLKASIDRLRQPQTRGSKWWNNPARLNQGSEGACVGFGHTQGYNSAPKQHTLDNAYALDVYRQATLIDEWPEDWTNSEGTSVRAGAKEMARRGLIPAYAFTYNVDEVVVWILNKGPVVFGCNWYTGQDNPRPNNDYFIKPTGQIRGGHCILVDGVRFNGNDQDYFRLLNSWGRSWGDDGRCKIKIPDFEKLLKQNAGVACTWIEQ